MQINLGLAAMIAPAGVSSDEFASVMQQSTVSAGASVRVPRGSRSWREFEVCLLTRASYPCELLCLMLSGGQDAVSAALNVAVIDSSKEAAAFFGRVGAGKTPVAVLAKAEGSDVVRVRQSVLNDSLVFISLTVLFL